MQANALRTDAPDTGNRQLCKLGKISMPKPNAYMSFIQH